MQAENSIVEAIKEVEKGLASVFERLDSKPKIANPKLVRDVIATARRELMVKELNRLNAKVKPDGTMNERDTQTYRAYNTHWKRLDVEFGARHIHTITSEEMSNFASAAATVAKANAKALGRHRSNGSRGFNMALDALNYLWVIALRDSNVETNLTKGFKRNTRKRGSRHGVTTAQLNEIIIAAGSGGRDPRLDYLITWFLSETAARRSGLLNLKLGDLDTDRCTVWLSEKFDSFEEQPVSPSLMKALLELTATRGDGKRNTNVFLRSSGESEVAFKPVDGKYVDALFARIRSQLKWADKLGFSAHWIRHYTATVTERACGLSISALFCRHKLSGVTASYSAANINDVARALQLLTGEAHPLAR
jgi:integrase